MDRAGAATVVAMTVTGIHHVLVRTDDPATAAGAGEIARLEVYLDVADQTALPDMWDPTGTDARRNRLRPSS